MAGLQSNRGRLERAAAGSLLTMQECHVQTRSIVRPGLLGFVLVHYRAVRQSMSTHNSYQLTLPHPTRKLQVRLGDPCPRPRRRILANPRPGHRPRAFRR